MAPTRIDTPKAVRPLAAFTRATGLKPTRVAYDAWAHENAKPSSDDLMEFADVAHWSDLLRLAGHTPTGRRAHNLRSRSAVRRELKLFMRWATREDRSHGGRFAEADYEDYRQVRPLAPSRTVLRKVYPTNTWQAAITDAGGAPLGQPHSRDPQRLTGALRKLRTRLRRNPGVQDWKEWHAELGVGGLDVVYAVFGSWPHFVRAAGFEYRRKRLRTGPGQLAT